MDKLLADRLMVGQRPLKPRIGGSSPSLPAMLRGWVAYNFLYGVTHPQQSGTQCLHNVQAEVNRNRNTQLEAYDILFAGDIYSPTDSRRG